MTLLRFILLLLLVLNLFSSCLNHESVLFQSYSIQTPDEITSVYFRDLKNGTAVGGKTWLRATVARTSDGGKTWKLDSLYDKEIFCSNHNTNNLLVAMGIDLKVYELREQQTIIHNINYTGRFRFIRGISVYDTNTILAVHGLANGSIEKFNLYSDSTRTVLNINHELNAIQCLDHLQCIACGYGIVLLSKDAGEHWDTLNVFGDNFVDIAFVAPSTIYLLGEAGTVLRSNDRGVLFNNVKSGGIIDNSATFSSICFKNSNEGLIAGKEGRVMLTRDGGNSWSIVDGLPSFDIKDIYHDGERYWLCGSAGTIIAFTL